MNEAVFEQPRIMVNTNLAGGLASDTQVIEINPLPSSSTSDAER